MPASWIPEHRIDLIFRLHPYLSQVELVAYCKRKGIAITAYSPTGTNISFRAAHQSRHAAGKATVSADPTIVDIATIHNVSPAQIILAWHTARGVSAVPKSTDRQRQKQNIHVSQLCACFVLRIITWGSAQLPILNTEDIDRIDSLDRNERISNKAGPDGKMLGWTYEQLGWWAEKAQYQYFEMSECVWL